MLAVAALAIGVATFVIMIAIMSAADAFKTRRHRA